MDKDCQAPEKDVEGIEGWSADRKCRLQKIARNGEGWNVQKQIALETLLGAAQVAEEKVIL